MSTGNDRLYFPGLHRFIYIIIVIKCKGLNYPSKSLGRKELFTNVYETGPGWSPVMNKSNSL